MPAGAVDGAALAVEAVVRREAVLGGAVSDAAAVLSGREVCCVSWVRPVLAAVPPIEETAELSGMPPPPWHPAREQSSPAVSNKHNHFFMWPVSPCAVTDYFPKKSRSFPTTIRVTAIRRKRKTEIAAAYPIS